MTYVRQLPIGKEPLTIRQATNVKSSIIGYLLFSAKNDASD